MVKTSIYKVNLKVSTCKLMEYVDKMLSSKTNMQTLQFQLPNQQLVPM